MPVAPREIPLSQAIAESPASAAALHALADSHARKHPGRDEHQTIRHWQADAGTFCYQTHIAITGQPRDRLDWLADILYNASTLPSQPWYTQFRGGASQAIDVEPPAGIDRHQLALGCFDLGMKAQRCYRQLVSLAWRDAATAVIVARSVPDGPAVPPGVRLAYTPAPNGEVLHWSDGCLHWHHVCCTPGAAMLPGALDRWLLNAMRRVGLDSAERATYRDEALAMRRWLQEGPA